LRLSAFVCVPCRAHCPGGTNPSSAWPFLYNRFACPDSLSARRWRFSQVPRLPLCVHAPLSDPGGVLSTRHYVSWTTAFRRLQTVGFPRLTPGYPLGPRCYSFRGSVTRPTHSLLLASYTPSWVCTQVRFRFGGSPLLMGIGQSPGLTHWVTLSRFTNSFPIPRIWI